MLENSALLNGLIGGMLIGLAASFMMLTNGRITGISGIASSLLKPEKDNFLWKLLFIAGLCLGTVLFTLFSGSYPPVEINASTLLLITAGLLVGFGTKLGSGCTSGHGICGIGRFSSRSIIATLVFMAVGICTVFLTRQLAELV